MTEHWFWWLLTMVCLVWYSSVTIYVAVRGYSDIKHMLARLEAGRNSEQAADSGTQ